MLSRSDLTRLAEALGGLPILGCLDGSPASEAGVRYGDVLLSIDGVPTPTWDAFIEVRAHCTDEMSVRLFREGAELDLTVPLRKTAQHPLVTLGELVARGIVPTGSSERGDN